MAERPGGGFGDISTASGLKAPAYRGDRGSLPLYRDLGGDCFRKRDPERQTKHLVAQLERLGHKVTFEALPGAA